MLTLTTDHSASSYGQPVLLVDGDRKVPYGPGDRLPDGRLAADAARNTLKTDPLLPAFLRGLPQG